MKKALINLALVFAAFNLAACSNNPLNQNPETYNNSSAHQVNKRVHENEKMANTQTLNNESGGAPVGGSMDENDKSKMFHALDNAPGKSAHWVNDNTGITYTVTPTKKINVGGNPLCREYETIATKGDKENKSYGTACVGTDGAWHSKK